MFDFTKTGVNAFAIGDKKYNKLQYFSVVQCSLVNQGWKYISKENHKQLFFKTVCCCCCCITFYRSLAVGSRNGFSLFSLNSIDSSLEEIYTSSGEEINIVERLFSSSLVAVVSLNAPRKLKVFQFIVNNIYVLFVILVLFLFLIRSLF